jgi:serine/threonine protein kinase
MWTFSDGKTDKVAYSKIQKLGQGENSIISKIQALGTTFALKEPQCGITPQEDQVHQLACNTSPLHIPKYIAAIKKGKCTTALVMEELKDAILLYDAMDNAKKSKMLAWCFQVVCALDELSAIEFTHYDLTPANVMLVPTKANIYLYEVDGIKFSVPTYGYVCKIIDFEFARAKLADGTIMGYDEKNEPDDSDDDEIYATDLGITSAHNPEYDLQLFFRAIMAKYSSLESLIKPLFTVWDTHDDDELDVCLGHMRISKIGSLTARDVLKSELFDKLRVRSKY